MLYGRSRLLLSLLLVLLCVALTAAALADPVFNVQLKSTKYTLSVGEQEAIEYTVTASSDVTDQTLTFATDNATVATVDATGKLDAKSVGYATITITHAAEPKLTLTCQVEVVSSSTMQLNMYSAILPENGSFLLTATTLSDALPVTFSTSNPAVCKVSSVDASTGKVEAVGEGTVQIVAANKHGVKAVCQVQVSKKKPTGTGTSNPDPGTSSTTVPSGTTAYVNTVSGGLNLRAYPDLTATILRVIPERAAFTVLEYGTAWCKAWYNGTTGYVMTQFVRLATDPVITPTTPPSSGTVIGQAVVKTPSGSLNMRVSPWIGAPRVRLIPRKAVVDILQYGAEWCYVRYNGSEGYAMTKFLSIGGSSSDSDDPVSKPTFAQVVTGGGGLNLRKKASTGSKRLTIIPEGMLVQVHSKGATWCKVSYNGKTGYVMTKFLKF